MPLGSGPSGQLAHTYNMMRPEDGHIAYTAQGAQGTVAGFNKVWVNASYEAAAASAKLAAMPAEDVPSLKAQPSSLSPSVFADGTAGHARRLADLYVQEDKVAVESARSSRFSPNASLNTSMRRRFDPSSSLDQRSALSSTQSSRASSAQTAEATAAAAAAAAAVAAGVVPGTPRVGNWTDIAKPVLKRTPRYATDDETEALTAAEAAADAQRAAAQQARPGYTAAALYEMDMSACMAGGALDARLAALLRAAPRAADGCPLVRCLVRRTKPHIGGKPFFVMSLQHDGSFLLAARQRVKTKASSYVISQDRDDTTRAAAGCVAKLKANLVGSEYILWTKPAAAGGAVMGGRGSQAKDGFEQHLVVDFKPTATKVQSGPRTMRVAMLAPCEASGGGGGAPAISGAGEDGLPEMLEKAKRKELPQHLEARLAVLHNRPPHWDARARRHTLDFPGHTDITPSVKNFQLSEWEFNHGIVDRRVLLQLAKVGDNDYALDFAYPMSAASAFAAALASIDTKLCFLA